MTIWVEIAVITAPPRLTMQNKGTIQSTRGKKAVSIKGYRTDGHSLEQ
jgi:hypothetical protein